MSLLSFVRSPSPPPLNAIELDTDEALTLLTPTLGPSCTLLVHRLARYLRDQEQVTFGEEELAATFGLAVAHLHRTIDRAAAFGVIHPLPDDSTCWVVRCQTAMAERWIRHLPEYLQPTEVPS